MSPEPFHGLPLDEAARAQLVAAAGVLTTLGRVFTEAGHELSLVGGPVRDALLGRLSPTADLDLTTDAHPEAVLSLLERYAETTWDVGIRFGTVGARIQGREVEITTYRAEQYDPDSRKPDVDFGDNLDDDLVRRDFTINAMAIRLPELQFVDLFGGLEDLAAGMIRTPGTPQDSFGDDPLRMLRAARFVSQLEFGVADRVRAAIVAMASQLGRITVERVAGLPMSCSSAAHRRTRSCSPSSSSAMAWRSTVSECW